MVIHTMCQDTGLTGICQDQSLSGERCKCNFPITYIGPELYTHPSLHLKDTGHLTGCIVPFSREDCRSACDAAGSNNDIFRNLASAAESGWDFSSRWLENPRELSTIHTTRVCNSVICTDDVHYGIKMGDLL